MAGIERLEQVESLTATDLTEDDSVQGDPIGRQQELEKPAAQHRQRSADVARIDRQKAYDYFWNTYRWDKTTVDQQVLTPLDERTLMGTAPDQTSIMCYQLPGAITRDGKPILGGIDINLTDYGFAARIYPKTAADTELGARDTPDAAPELDDWDASEDVEVSL